MNWIESINIGFNGLVSHKLRSLLTMLGVIFGVAAVISMVSIGAGAKFQAIRQIELMGTNNITIKPRKLFGNEEKEAKRKGLKGIELVDVESLDKLYPTVTHIAALVNLKDEKVRVGTITPDANIIGITPDYLEVTGAEVGKGRFILPLDRHLRAKVCVLGSELAQILFPFQDLRYRYRLHGLPQA